MIQSMTGFGAAQKGNFKVEIRSINHRFLDIFIKMPQNLNEHEMSLRNRLKEKFSRGRFDVFVTPAEETTPAVKVNVGLAREVISALTRLREEFGLEGTVSIETVAGFKELILSEETSSDAASLFGAFDEALGRLREMRCSEGEAMARDILSRVAAVDQARDEMATLNPGAVGASKEKFLGRLNTLFEGMSFDENRVLQEAALLAERGDISEELTRIASHTAQVRKIVHGGDRIGRKLEFLLQELYREANTIASKADDFRITNCAVEMKTEIEKMREQAQNLQ